MSGAGVSQWPPHKRKRSRVPTSCRELRGRSAPESLQNHCWQFRAGTVSVRDAGDTTDADEGWARFTFPTRTWGVGEGAVGGQAGTPLWAELRAEPTARCSAARRHRLSPRAVGGPHGGRWDAAASATTQLTWLPAAPMGRSRSPQAGKSLPRKEEARAWPWSGRGAGGAGKGAARTRGIQWYFQQKVKRRERPGI